MGHTRRIQALRAHVCGNVPWDHDARAQLFMIISAQIHEMTGKQQARSIIVGSEGVRVRAEALCIFKEHRLHSLYPSSFIELLDCYLKIAKHDHFTNKLLKHSIEHLRNNEAHQKEFGVITHTQLIERIEIAGLRGVCSFILRPEHKEFFYAEVLFFTEQYVIWADKECRT